METKYTRPSKDESFMEIAQTVSLRSTCLRRRYGAVIVSKDGRIVSTGYNGAPRHRANCTDLNSCLRDELGVKPGTHYELCRAVHAEANAIINGDPLDIIGGTLYLSGTDVATNKPSKYISPCAMCERLILNAQIARVVMRDADMNLVEVNPLDWDDDSSLLAEHKRNLQLGQNGQDASTVAESVIAKLAAKGGCCCSGDDSTTESKEEHSCCCSHESESKKEHSCCCSNESESKEEHSCCCSHESESKEEHSCCSHESESKEEHSCCCSHESESKEEHSCCCSHESEPKKEHSCCCSHESESKKEHSCCCH